MPAAAMPRGPLGFLGLTLGGACLVSISALLAGMAGNYAPGLWSEAFAIPVAALPLLAAWSPLAAAIPAASEELEECPGRLQLLLPFIPAAAGWAVVLVQLGVARDRLDWQTIGLAAFVVGGLFLRQYLTLRDLERLSRSLETRVLERTRELSHAQDVMVRTERMNTMATLGAGLAHDLKNLIGVVRNYALLVHRDLQEGRPAEMEDLEAIQLASGQAVDLANQLMNYGRTEEEENETFDLGLQLQQLATMLQAIMPPEIKLVAELPGYPMLLKENPFHIDQMVVNLVLNAQDALPAGGWIELKATGDHLENGKPAVRLEVADNGTGISESVKARLFEPFFTTKSPGKGTGIGLASVKEAIRGFGGSIHVESEPGKGSRFIILLPLA
jgi:signal transduction histidine kinase